MSARFNYKYLFYFTLKYIIIAALGCFVCVLLAVGVYQNIITVSNWWFSLDFSMPDISQFSDLAVILVKLLITVVLVYFFKLLGFYAVTKVFSKFQFKEQSYFDKETAIKYEKPIDFEAINSGFDFLWYSIIVFFTSLLTYFMFHAYIFFAVLVIAFGVFIVGVKKIIVGKKPGKERRTLYPRTPEFSSIMMDYSLEAYDDNKEIIDRLEALDEGILEYELSRLIIKKIQGENIDLPYDSVAFGEPEDDVIQASMEQVINYDNSDFRVG